VAAISMTTGWSGRTDAWCGSAIVPTPPATSTGRVILEQGLLFDVTELKEAEARMTHMAYHDALTGLANRELFRESLHLGVERARRDGTSIAVLYLDLDNFKQLNDTEGHHVGDRLLASLGDGLRPRPVTSTSSHARAGTSSCGCSPTSRRRRPTW
jgi:PleD family two-component response regulator